MERTTHDVDVIAVVSDSGQGDWIPPEISAPLADATKRVARDFNLTVDWFNTMVGMQWRAGLPEGIREDVEWERFRGLRVGLVGRQTLITLKLFAAVDQGPESVHLQDLRVLSPTDVELERARRWVETQDTAPQFPSMVSEVVSRVRSTR